VTEIFIFENILKNSFKFGNSSYEGKIEGRIEGIVRRGRSRKRLLDGFKEKRGKPKFKEKH
jgi:hypothetical protein